MKREMVRDIPIRYNSFGEPFCAVPNCMKLPDKFKNGNSRKYCDLHDSYSLIRERYWSFFKTRILMRDVCCVKCGSKEDLQVDHIIALVNGGDMWNENNLQTLCVECHKKKTKEDLKERKKKKILKLNGSLIGNG